MTVIAHLSDLHFGSLDAACAEALLIDLAAAPPHLVCISGDLTQVGAHAEFEAAQVFLSRLPAPWLAVPGNHDITPYHVLERFLDPFGRWRRYVSQRLEPAWTDGPILVQGLNSARPFGPYLNWSRGQFSPAQVAAVAEAERPGWLVGVAHHPVAYGNDRERSYDLVTRAGEMLAALAAGPGGVLLLGHRHRTHVSTWNIRDGERPARQGGVLGPDEVLLVHAGTATSDRLRGEENAYCRLILDVAGIAVETRSWDGAAFARSAMVGLRRLP